MAEISGAGHVNLEILLLSVTFSTVFGVTFGVITAVKQNSIIDYAFRIFAVFGQSIPSSSCSC